MTKKNTLKITTREEAEVAMERLATATHWRDKKMAQMNIELTEIRTLHENEISLFCNEISDMEKALKKWADKSPQLFGKMRSLKLLHGTIGYRTGQPSVKLISGISLERALAFLKERFPKFIRTKEEIDKEAIIAGRATLSEEELAVVGLRIEQGEKFFVEVEKDEVGE